MKAGSEELKNTLSNVLTNIEKMNTHSVTEKEFVRLYLPIALARYNGQIPELTAWAYGAGGVHNGFNVTDDAGQEILFKTPGVMLEGSFEIDGGLIDMMADVADAQRLKLDPSSVYAKHLNQDKAKLRLSDSSEHHLAWYRIFARYGYKMASADGTVSATPKDNGAPSDAGIEWGDDEFA